MPNRLRVSFRILPGLYVSFGRTGVRLYGWRKLR